MPTQQFRRSDDLLSLSIRLVSYRSSKPRDKAYSLLGLAHSACTLSIVYTLGVPETFINIAIHIIQESRSLDVLIFSGSALPELPSWVPDCRDPDRCRSEQPIVCGQRAQPSRLVDNIFQNSNESSAVSLGNTSFGSLTIILP